MMSTRKAAWIVLLGIAVTVSTAAAVIPSEVSGKAPTATRKFPSVVILEDGNAGTAPVPSEPVVMDQIDKTFVPGVLVARVGQPVTFKNSENMLHNVKLFDLGRDEVVFNIAMPVMGMTQNHTFPEAGTFAVLCDVHPEMEAYIVVTESPYAAVAGEGGDFELKDVPEGSYTARVWNVDESKRRETQVTVSGSGNVLDLSAE